MSGMHERIAASFNAQGLMATLGAKLALVSAGEVHIVLPFSERLSQQRGYVHAGAITSIRDSACGYAALTHAPPEGDVVTAEFKINFLRPALGIASWPSDGYTVRDGFSPSAVAKSEHSLGTIPPTRWSHSCRPLSPTWVNDGRPPLAAQR